MQLSCGKQNISQLKDGSKDTIGNAAERENEMGDVEERLGGAERKAPNTDAAGRPGKRRNAGAPIPEQRTAEGLQLL